MVQVAEIDGNSRPANLSRPFVRCLTIFLAGIVLFIAFDLLDGKLFNGDPDDIMRAVQIRTLLETGGWFDHSIPSIQMPETYRSPWSRLVDLPYLLVATLVRPVFGMEGGLWLAFQAWPAVMAGLYAILAVGILRRIAPGDDDLPISMLLAVLIFSTYAAWEFSPGRIDHHNVQILLVLAMLNGILRWDAAGGVMTGVAVSAAVAVGLETLPLVAILLFALVLAWSLGADGSRRFLRATGLAVAVSAITLAAVLLPPGSYLEARNDAFSAPYIEALVGFGILAFLLPIVLSPGATLMIRGTVFAVSGSVVLLAILWSNPGLANGPLPMVTGLARVFWFDRIHQEMPVTLFFRIGDHRAIALVGLMLATLILAFPAMERRIGGSRTPFLVLFAVAVAAFVMTLVSNRTLRLALAIVPLLLPFAVATVREALRAPQPRRAGRLAAILTSSLAAYASLYVVVPRGVPDFDAYDYLLMNGCDREDLTAFGHLGRARVMVPPALGLRIIGQGFPGVSVSTVPFHRASPGINNLLAFYQSKSSEDRAALVEDFDYLAICRSPPRLVAEEELPVFASLMAGRDVPGLVPVKAGGDLLLFRIDHAAAR